MAGRPPKTSIAFAGWAVDIFDNEPKIDKLMDAQGCVGFTIYFYLCQRAYGSAGYYYLWSYDDAATTARKIGGGAGSQAVINTVDLCFRVGLFDNDLHDRHGILTSRGIQRRYKQVAIARTDKSVIREYWLLDEEESAGLDFRTLKSDNPSSELNFTPPKLNYDTRKFNYQPQKYSKVYPPISPQGDDRNVDDDTENAESKPRKNRKVDFTSAQAAEFELFWREWPNRVSRGQAETTWKKINPDGKLTEAIVEGVKKAVQQDRRFQPGGFMPHPSTWLNSKGWLDEFTADSAQTPKAPPEKPVNSFWGGASKVNQGG